MALTAERPSPLRVVNRQIKVLDHGHRRIRNGFFSTVALARTALWINGDPAESGFRKIRINARGLGAEWIECVSPGNFNKKHRLREISWRKPLNSLDLTAILLSLNERGGQMYRVPNFNPLLQIFRKLMLDGKRFRELHEMEIL